MVLEKVQRHFKNNNGGQKWPAAILLFTFLFVLSIYTEAQTYRRLVNFDWEVIDGATAYEIEMKQVNKENAKTYTFKVQKAEWSGRLTPGKYVMKLRSLDYRSVPGEWSTPSDFEVNLEAVKLIAPTNNLQLASKESKEEDVLFKWQPISAANSYHFELTSADGKFTKTETVSGTEIKLSIPVATEYTWKVSATGPNGMQSEATSIGQFQLLGNKLEKPVIEKPETKFVREIKWNRPEHTEKFDFALARYNKSSKTWEKLAQGKDSIDEKLDIDEKLPGGTYKISVRGKGVLRTSSEVSSITFDVKDGNRSPAAEYTSLVRQSIDRVQGWYGIASYLITQINYQSTYQETNTAISYDALGGTGRLGLGWFSPTSSWGFISIVDLSGFTNSDGNNLTFASAEAAAVWRKNAGERGEFRVQMGMYYKELPGTIGEASSGSVSNEQIATAGPHIGGEYWHSMTPKLGLQVNAHFYMSMMKMKTPNNGNVEPSISTQYGFLGSYRLSPRMTGLMGYARREDKVKYSAGSSSTFPTSGSNETTVTGDYLNFYCEYAF